MVPLSSAHAISSRKLRPVPDSKPRQVFKLDILAPQGLLIVLDQEVSLARTFRTVIV